MAYEKRNNEGTLFPNNKGDNPKRPDYKGALVLPDGHEVELVAWLKTGKNSGKEFLSLKIGNYTSPQQGSAPPKARAKTFDDIQDNEVPF
jgi:uncharacterized protein (DUF736 family)